MPLKLSQLVPLCILILRLAGPIQAAEANQLITASIRSLNQGKVAEARAELAKALELDPRNPEASFRLGLLLGQVSDNTGAVEAFRKALALKPNWPEAHYNLGLALTADMKGRRDWQGAISAFREAIRQKASYTEARLALAAALYDSGDANGALKELQGIIAINPSSALAHLQAAKALERNSEPAKAEAQYREALRLRPDYTEAQVSLASLLSTTEEALPLLRQALQSNPDNQSAQYAMAKRLNASGRAAEASIAFQQASALAFRRQKLVRSNRLSNEGLDAARQKNLSLAMQKLREAVSLCPDAALAHFNLGVVLADSDQMDAAEAQVVQAISLTPSDGRFYLTLGRMFLRAGHISEARDALQLASGFPSTKPAAFAELEKLTGTAAPVLPADPYRYGAPFDTADGHFAFATVLAQRGDWLGATGEWLRVLALRPNYADARNNLGISYIRLSRASEGELEFHKILLINPNSSAAHFGLAVSAMERNDKTRAATELREVLRIQPNYPQARQLLATASK